MSDSPIKDPLPKIKLIYLPFLVLAVGFVVIYTFLNWLLFLKFELFAVNEPIIEIILPMILSLLAVLILIRKRLKLLKFKEKVRDPHFLYIMIAAIAIAIPTIIAQGYIKTASGRLSKITSSMLINRSKLTKYYQFDEEYLDKRFTGVHWSVETTGKHNEYMVFHGFFALPIMTQAKDTSQRFFNTWYGIEYKDQISNRLEQSEKETFFKKFQNRSIDTYNQKNLYDFNYFDRLGTNGKHKGLLEAITTTNEYDHTVSTIILCPVNEPFELRNGNKFIWIFGSFGIAGFIWFLMIIAPPVNTNELKKFLSGNSTLKKTNVNKFKFKSLMNLIPNKKSSVFFVLIELNTLVYLVMVFAGLGLIDFSSKDLLKWGANFRPLITNGEYWRLFTSMFLHGGLFHLVMNMYALFFVGIFLEPVLGRKRFAIFYLLTGIIASISSIWWHQSVVSVGASGAIFGMYGIFLALLLTKLFPTDFKKSFLLSTVIFVGYNLIMGLSGGIDNAAHIGGLASGILIGFINYPFLKNETEREASIN